MAQISSSGKITGKKTDPPVVLRQVGEILNAEFSMIDSEYCYFKNYDDNPGQFYKVHVTGRNAQWVYDNLVHGSKITVHGQPVWREYNGNRILDIKNARVQSLDDKKPAEAEAESKSLF